MAISTKIEYESIDKLYLDPFNPRLGRNVVKQDSPQATLLEIMSEWVLDELALSFLENGGFWSHEPLLVVEEQLYGAQRLVVVEGNRRLAALKRLKQAFAGEVTSRKWTSIVDEYEKTPDGLFSQIPFVRCDNRGDVQAYLGFRHVTGIKQWNTDEKAAYISKLIDSGMSYLEVARKIGSKSPTVRKHYVAFKTLEQIEDQVEDFQPERASRRFAVLYMSIDTIGAQKFLDIEINAPTDKLKEPVPETHLDNLKKFALWLFGNDELEPLVKDTRQVSNFSSILENEKAVEYLKSKKQPLFEVAFRISGGDESQIVQYVNEAADSVELALMRAHAFKESEDLQKAVQRLGEDSVQLIKIFPEVDSKLFGEV